MSKKDFAWLSALALIIGAGYAGWSYLGGFPGIAAGILILAVLAAMVFGSFMSLSDGKGIQAVFYLGAGVLAVGVILLMLWLWNKNNTPIPNTAVPAAECSVVYQAAGVDPAYACQTSRDGWVSFVLWLKMEPVNGTNYEGKAIEALLTDCPEVCTPRNCGCILNQTEFAVVYGEYRATKQVATAKVSAEAEKAEGLRIANETGATDVPPLANMAGGLMAIGGIVNLLNWLVAIPIACKSVPWIKVTATTIFVVVIITMYGTGVWDIFSSSYWEDGEKIGDEIVRLVMIGAGLFFANPIISLIAFGLGLAGAGIATQSKNGGWVAGIAAGILVLAAGALGVIPNIANTLIVIKSGINPWIATQALFVGYLLPAGIISVTLGPIWTVLGAWPAMMKGVEALEKLGG